MKSKRIQLTILIMTCIALICVMVLASCSTGTEPQSGVASDGAQSETSESTQVDNNQPETAENGQNEGVSGNSQNGAAGGNTPFGAHGVLAVQGSDLVDCEGKKFQLHGMSTHGIAWFPEYINRETFAALRDDWNTNCVRLAMYTDENGGYCSGGDQEQLRAKVCEGIDTATDLGMYVIVDWHILSDQDPGKYEDQAAEFFDYMSAEYGGQGNVIYEICNEPNGSATWESVTAYAGKIIPVIRRNDPDSVILVGTPTWSQDIDRAAADPLDYGNIMYTLHFYAATHTEWLRDRMEKCIKGGLPVFVSEFGICDASGSGKVDIAQADQWKDLIKKYGISYICWNLSNKDESSAVIRSGCDKLSGWDDADLSEQGLWIRDWFRSE